MQKSEETWKNYNFSCYLLKLLSVGTFVPNSNVWEDFIT